MNEQTTKTQTYSNRLGDINFIVTNHFSGTKTISDAFENIILERFRGENNTHNDFNKSIKSVQNRASI